LFVAYDVYEIAHEGATAVNVISLGLDIASTAGFGALLMAGVDRDPVGGFFAGIIIFGFIGLILMVPIGNFLGSLSIGGELKEIVQDLREAQKNFAMRDSTGEVRR